MDTAIAFNKTNQSSRVVTAAEFKKLITATPEAALTHDLLSPRDADPMHFINAYYRSGRKVLVREHFARAAGHGDSDHIFDRQKENETLKQALDQKKKVLLSLNGKLCSDTMNFGKARGCLPLEVWIRQNYNNYISISVKTAEDVVEKIHQIQRHLAETLGDAHATKEIKTRVFALHRGGVQSYEKFYVGKRTKDLNILYNDLFMGKGIEIGETRRVGPPVLLRVVPTKTTLKKMDPKIIHGNYDQNTGLLCALVFEDQNANQTAAYRDLEAEMTGNPDEGVYVLACPSITLPAEGETKAAMRGKKDWRHMRFAIYDITAQTKPAHKAAREMGHNLAIPVAQTLTESQPEPAPAR